MKARVVQEAILDWGTIYKVYIKLNINQVWKVTDKGKETVWLNRDGTTINITKEHFEKYFKMLDKT